MVSRFVGNSVTEMQLPKEGKYDTIKVGVKSSVSIDKTKEGKEGPNIGSNCVGLLPKDQEMKCNYDADFDEYPKVMTYFDKMSNVSKKTYFVLALVMLALIGIISSTHATPSSFFLNQELKADSVLAVEAPTPPLRRNLKGDTSKAIVVNNNELLSSDLVDSSISKVFALTSSDSVSSREGEESCDDAKSAIAAATGLGAAIFGIIASGGTAALPIALAGFFGAGNAFTNLWSCPGFALNSYEEFSREVNDLIAASVADGTIRQFQDLEDNMKSDSCRNLATTQLHSECFEKPLQILEVDVINPSLASDGVITKTARIAIAAALEYSRIMLMKISRGISFNSNDSNPCKHDVDKFYREIDQVIKRIEKAHEYYYNIAYSEMECWAICLPNIALMFILYTQCYVPALLNDGTYKKLGIEIEYSTTRFSQYLCPPSNNERVSQRVRDDYLKSRQFNWWRDIQPALRALKNIRDNSSQEDMVKLCGKKLCTSSNGIGCFCVNDSMCGGDSSCYMNKCIDGPCTGVGCLCVNNSMCASGCCYYGVCSPLGFTKCMRNNLN